MLPEINGKIAYIYKESDFDADLICGLDNYTVTDPQKLKELCMEDIDPHFKEVVEPGDVVVCGKNVGYGHPHIGGPVGLMMHGVVAFIAESYCPGFYRAQSLRGIPLIECEGILEYAKAGEHIRFDWDTCELHLMDSEITLPCKVIPQKSLQLIELGGIMPYIQKVRMA